MAEKIRLAPELHDYLLSLFPPRSDIFRTLATATEFSTDLDNCPVTYEIVCNEDVARTIFSVLQERKPDELIDIFFGLRVLRSKERQPPLRGCRQIIQSQIGHRRRSET
jgi:hypothetical protein